MLYPTIDDDFDEEEVDAIIDSKNTDEQSPKKPVTFNSLCLSRSILKAVFEAGFLEPTPIQAACIPVALSGSDLCACASTGTGKTAAFMLPILERLIFKPRGDKPTTRVLVLVPTRELAIQVFDMSRRLANHTNISFTLAVGGLDIKAQEASLRLGHDIVIATPGRLVDHLNNSPTFTLSNIEVLVLDEADRMLEEQFMDQMKAIIKLCSTNRQTMLFSATLTEEVEDLVNLSLNKPVKLYVNETTDLALKLSQEFVRIRNEHGPEERERRREAIVATLVAKHFPQNAIIFIRTKRDCERMNVLLRLLDVKVGRLHGGLTQQERVGTLKAFKRQEEVCVLCATDLAARGLDIEEVVTVINMHMPSTLKQYIHRVGRTARAGKTGRSISLIGEEDRKLMKEIQKMNSKGGAQPFIQRKTDPEIIGGYLMRIAELGPVINQTIEEEKYAKHLLKAEKSLKEAETKLKLMSTKKPDNSKHSQSGFKQDRKTKKNGMIERKKKMSKGRRREEKKTKKFGNKEERQTSRKEKQRLQPNNPSGKSSFTFELADISDKAIKRHRHGPDDPQFRLLKRTKEKNGRDTQERKKL